MVSQEGPSQPKKRLTRYSDAMATRSHRRCSIKIGVLRNLSKFAGKHLRQVSIFVKLQALGLRPAALLKKRPWHRCFPVNFEKFERTLFLQSTSGRLLLNGKWISFYQKIFKTSKCQEYKLHCSICNFNLSCTHGGINDVRYHVGRDKHKAAKKN